MTYEYEYIGKFHIVRMAMNDIDAVTLLAIIRKGTEAPLRDLIGPKHTPGTAATFKASAIEIIELALEVAQTLKAE